MVCMYAWQQQERKNKNKHGRSHKLEGIGGKKECQIPGGSSIVRANGDVRLWKSEQKRKEDIEIKQEAAGIEEMRLTWKKQISTQARSMEKKLKTFSWQEIEDGLEGRFEMQQALSYISLTVRAKKRRERECVVFRTRLVSSYIETDHILQQTLCSMLLIYVSVYLSIILEQARLVHSWEY